uniref:Uncharacterized protein n=1 Tax=Setaria viridis TaxID=4556 RepID=A0A4U6TIX2_SETVI|nr:hypothetical protein SEVIR_8G239475v2 [Setaria viridis]
MPPRFMGNFLVLGLVILVLSSLFPPRPPSNSLCFVACFELKNRKKEEGWKE